MAERRLNRHSYTCSEGYSSLFARQNGCVQCETATLVCPSCADDESCQYTSLSCSDCPKAYCAKDTTTDSSSTTSVSSGPNVGAIAGGVIGGLAVIGIITYLVWRFCIKTKRNQWQDEPWAQDGPRSKEGSDMDYVSRASQRQSTHSVQSMASTVLTRASNIIQIAYIPGVTNRATPTSPTLLVPPVPPIPLALSDTGSPSPYEEQHFFVPGNLRDSSYSGISGYTDRTSYARTSYAPRSSVASTIYGKNAVVSPMPAQKGTLLKPSLVSVKSKGASSGSSTPPVPQVDYDKYDQPLPSPAFSIGATFFKNASTSTATAVRPQLVSLGSSNGAKTVDVKRKSPTVSVTETEHELSAQTGDSNAIRESDVAVATPINGSPKEAQSPFSDPPKTRGSKHKSSNSLSAIISEATQRAASGSRTSSTSSKIRDSSPFGDEHALRG
jgi:protein OPY2